MGGSGGPLAKVGFGIEGRGRTGGAGLVGVSWFELTNGNRTGPFEFELEPYEFEWDIAGFNIFGLLRTEFKIVCRG